MAGGCRSAPLPRGTWQPLGAEGCSGTPRGEQDGGHRAARTHPHLPPAPRLDLSSGKENGSGGEPRQEGLRAGGGAVGWGAGTPLWLSPPRAPLRALRVSLPGALPCRCAADGGRDGGVEPGERRAGGGTDHPGRAAVLHGRRAGDPRGGCGPGARCPRTRRALGTTAGALPSQAIQNPGDLRLQERAWSAVCPLVAKLKRFYEFSLRLGERLTSPASPAVHPASLPAGRNGTGCGSPGRGVCAQLGMPSRASVSLRRVERCRGGPGVLCPQRTPCGACWRPLLAPPTLRPSTWSGSRPWPSSSPRSCTSPSASMSSRCEGESPHRDPVSQQSPLGPLTVVCRPPPQMTNPAIQNDFSYYRRTISRNRINNLQVRGLCCPPGQGWPPPGAHRAGMAPGGFSHPSDPHHTPPSWTQRAR